MEQIRSRGRKGSLQALRNAVLLKTVYAFGLPRSEVVGLDLTDLRVNPKAADYGRCGGVFVRWAKSSRGGPPKRRTVLTVPEMDWIVGILGHYVDEVRPHSGADPHPAFWLTERCGRITNRSVNEAFAETRSAAGLPPELDLHSLRHSYITHLKVRGIASDASFDRNGDRDPVRDLGFRGLPAAGWMLGRHAA